MEIGESSAAGAARETQEEANAAVHILGPYAHWDIPVIGQVGSCRPVGWMCVVKMLSGADRVCIRALVCVYGYGSPNVVQSTMRC